MRNIWMRDWCNHDVTAAFLRMISCHHGHMMLGFLVRSIPYLNLLSGEWGRCGNTGSIVGVLGHGRNEIQENLKAPYAPE